MHRRPSYEEIEQVLTSLGDRLYIPAEPDIASAVRVQLETHPIPPRSGWVQPAPAWRPALAVATTILVLAVAIMVFSPATRDAVADWIGFDGVRITPVPEPDERIGTDLALGDPITLAEGEARVSFPVRVPSLLGAPDEVYVDGRGEYARLSFVYRARDDLPAADTSEVGALIEQFRATIEREILSKQIFGGTDIRVVEVAGTEGYWLSGGPHQVTYLDPDGVPTQDEQRLAGSTLLWEIDGVVYRLESDVPLARALEIAGSMF